MSTSKRNILCQKEREKQENTTKKFKTSTVELQTTDCVEGSVSELRSIEMKHKQKEMKGRGVKRSGEHEGTKGMW